jgi:short-subunit dehydrogenase
MIRRGSGKIVNNASVSAIMHFPCASTYAASKAAVLAFTDCLEIELKETGVSTLVLITPGIKTRMFDDIDTKYSDHLEVPQDSISTEEYAQQIKAAIFDDRSALMPKGLTAIGLWVSKYLPALFKFGTLRRFHR